MPPPEQVAILVDQLIAGLYRKRPDARSIPYDTLRRNAAAFVLADLRNKPSRIDPE